MSAQIETTLLGTGTSQGIPVIGCRCKVCTSTDPRDKRLRTAAYLYTDQTGLAIDLGPDFRQQMLQNDLADVQAVLLTHEHNDHISGLDDVRPINFLYKRNIPIYGLSRSLDEVYRRFYYAFDEGYHYPGKPRVSLVRIQDQPFRINNTLITPLPVDHGGMSVLGFRVGDFAYITDAKRIPEQSMGLLQGLKVLVLNALRFEPHATHLNIEEATEVVNQLNPVRCYLTHISHDAGLHAEIESKLPEHIRVGYDGLKITI